MKLKNLSTEEKIFEAATEIFIRKGLDGARMQDIADLAGINKSLLHYYYRTKNHLFDAVFEKKAAEMFTKFAPIMDEKLSLEEKVRFFFREHISFLQQNPRLPGFLLNEINHHPERIQKLIQHFEVKRLWHMLESQHKKELEHMNITEKMLPQLLSSVVSLSVFPFAAKGIVETILNSLGLDFGEYLEERKDYAAEFVIRSLKK